MSMTTDDKLIYMANQIARNFAALGYDHAVAATEDHLRKFWEPRMRARIRTLAAERQDALLPIAAAAIDQLPTSAG